jgi:hypothetical protein
LCPRYLLSLVGLPGCPLRPMAIASVTESELHYNPHHRGLRKDYDQSLRCSLEGISPSLTLRQAPLAFRTYANVHSICSRPGIP